MNMSLGGAPEVSFFQMEHGRGLTVENGGATPPWSHFQVTRTPTNQTTTGESKMFLKLTGQEEGRGMMQVFRLKILMSVSTLT